MYRILILCLILFSCVSQEIKKDLPKETQVTQECDFVYLEKRFYAEAVNNGLTLLKRNVVIKLATDRSQWGCQGPSTVGCTSEMIIMFLESYWKSANCVDREILFFHEYGHILGKDHVAPPAIMQPNMLTEKQYLKDRESLLKAFFKL